MRGERYRKNYISTIEVCEPVMRAGEIFLGEGLGHWHFGDGSTSRRAKPALGCGYRSSERCAQPDPQVSPKSAALTIFNRGDGAGCASVLIPGLRLPRCLWRSAPAASSARMVFACATTHCGKSDRGLAASRSPGRRLRIMAQSSCRQSSLRFFSTKPSYVCILPRRSARKEPCDGDAELAGLQAAPGRAAAQPS